MDSCKSFMEIFKRCVTERNSNDLLTTLKESRRYFQHISYDDTEMVLSILFDKSDGLLCFLTNEITKPFPQKAFDMAVKEVFHLLEFIMEEFRASFEPYIIPTKKRCELGLITRCSGFIQRAACSTFNTLIRLFNEYDINLPKTVSMFVRKFHVLQIKERSWVLSVLGSIARYDPDVPELCTYSNTIFRQIRNDFKMLYKPGVASQSTEIHIYFEVLADMMEVFSPSEEIKKNYYTEIYTWIKDLAPIEKHQFKKVLMRSVLMLLTRRMDVFADFVYVDYKLWHELFVHLAKEKNADNAQCGRRGLKSFYKIVGRCLNDKNTEADKAIFLYFHNLLMEQLTKSELDTNLLQLTTYGFSQMAAPCKRYLTDTEVKEMYKLIVRCAVSLCADEVSGVTQYDSICYYQEALSEILHHITDISFDQINVLTKLSTLLIKRFPDLSVMSQAGAVTSLIKTIINVASLGQHFLDKFLDDTIHDGIIWSCSHTLYVDAELERDLKNLKERPITYADYLSLWVELLKDEKYKPYGRIETLQLVFDKVITTCIHLINKVNLNTKTKTNNIFSDISLSQTAVNETDFRIFINIVDLYVNIINVTKPYLLRTTVHKFLYEIVRKSYKYPLISGFYKLAHIVFKTSDIFCDTVTKQHDREIVATVNKYLMYVLDQISTFSNELLVACIHLILDMPIIYVKHLIDRTGPVFRIAFSMGLTDFVLACATLNTLEKWISHLEVQYTQKLLQEIIPALEPFLQSKESAMQLSEDITNLQRVVIKRIAFIDNEKTLENFQRRILLLYGALNVDLMLDFLHNRSLETRASWDKKDLIEYTLPFPDIQISIYFDTILPRLMTLAQNCGDRQTKMIACEVLHLIIRFTLGRMSEHMSEIDRFEDLYNTLCPALLNLGCDTDIVVRRLFQPLILQLTHWLSSELVWKSRITIHLIDSIFDGLTNDSNTSLREFSGMCLAEFTTWLRKQLDEQMFDISIRPIMRKIMHFALHPSTQKRVAAATAFNYLYTILREDEKIITIYWLELFYCFVKSLNGCDNPSIVNAIDHIEKVIRFKVLLLNKNNKDRRKPHEFKGETLSDAVYWLFTQSGSLDPISRKNCMDLYVKISQYIISNCTPIDIMERYINVYGIEIVNSTIFGNMIPKIEDISFNSILLILRSIECYIWLIQNKLIDPKYLFTNFEGENDVIFNYMMNFGHLVVNVEMEINEDEIMVSKEFQDLQALQCKTILRIFQFILILLSLPDNPIPNSFFNTDVFELVARCIFQPQNLGFDTKNMEMTELLPLQLEQLLGSLKQSTNITPLKLLEQQLSRHVECHIKVFFNLEMIMNSDISTNSDLRQYVKGLILLQRCDLLKGNNLFENIENNIHLISQSLCKGEIGEFSCISLKPSVVEYLQSLMKLMLIKHKPSVTKILVNLIANDTLLLCSDSTKIMHGMYFLDMFKELIFTYMIQTIKETMIILVESLVMKPTALLNTVEGIVLFVKKHKKQLEVSPDLIIYPIIESFVHLEKAAGNMESRKQILINIYGAAVHVMERPTDIMKISNDFYVWILRELTMTLDIEYKTLILENFLIALTDETSNEQPELSTILRTLRNDRMFICKDNLRIQTTNTLKVINCFETLLTLLPVTKSVIVWDSLIFFATGSSAYLCNDKTTEYLKKYFNNISSETALMSLETPYKLFLESNDSTTCRFDILEKFLLPSFEYCRVPEIEKFYERNLNNIYQVLRQSLIGEDSAVRQSIISKIGCYNLVGILISKIPEKIYIEYHSNITQNVGDAKTGKELVRQLYLNSLCVRGIMCTNPDHKEIMRRLHCSAYNCSIAIVSLQEDESFYVSVFGENKKKGQFIWKNIIDCEKQFHFSQTVEEYPKNQKKLINIRKRVNAREVAVHSHSYIYSYNVATSTLTEDINAYDLNEARILSKSNPDVVENTSLLFESDYLNNHECMPYVCGILRHMKSLDTVIHTEVSPAYDIIIPQWLKCFQRSMLTEENVNIKLFMLKVILNTQTIFKSYAQFFLAPIINVVNSYLRISNFNYIIADTLLMLIDWHTVAVPNNDSDKKLAQKMVELIVHKVLIQKPDSMTKAVHKYNINILNMIIEVWHTFLEVTKNLKEKMISAPESTVDLILIYLQNHMQQYIIYRDDVLDFLQNFLDNWRDKEESVLKNLEALGLIFKYLQCEPSYANKTCEMHEKIRSIFRQMQTKSESRQIKCIRALCKHFPNLAMQYIEFVTSNIFRHDSLGKALCLEIFLFIIPNLTEEDIVRELSCMKFHDFLRNKVSPCEKVSLKIIAVLVSILTPMNIVELITLVPHYAKNIVVEYRGLAYDICMDAYKKYYNASSNDENIRTIKCTTSEVLLVGLLDPAESLQDKVLKFWTDDIKFSDSSKDRLLQILDIYTPDAQDAYLPFFPLIMLNLTNKSVHYERKLFKSLYDCDYKDYKIAVLKRIKNLGSIAPLFASSLASQMNHLFTQAESTYESTIASMSYAQSLQDSNRALQLRTTQEPMFEPTFFDDVSSDILSSYSLQYTEEADIPQPAHNIQSRRFLAKQSDTSRIMQQRELKRNVQQSERIKEETLRQRSNVKLYRSYRVGDFPDIEITHADLIKSLQELVKKDQLICKNLTASIFSSLIREVNNHESSNNFSERISTILNTILQQNFQGKNPFIAAVLETMIISDMLNCSPQIVAKASASNELNCLGILFLENCLIYNVDDIEPKIKKRKGNNSHEFSNNNWVELAKLYETMNETDIVLSIFHNHVETEALQEASCAHAAADWITAKAAYEKVYLSETESFREHCLQGALECYNQLSSWNNIDNYVNKELDGNFDNIWRHEWKNLLFPWMFKVSVHHLLNDSDDDTLRRSVVAIESWLKNENKLQYIKRSFGEELAIFWIYQGQEVIAGDFLVNTLDEVREQWIRLSPLSIQLRCSKLEKLRSISDINVYLKTAKFKNITHGLKHLLKFWTSKVPSIDDNLLLWDTLVSYRVFFDSLLRERINLERVISATEKKEAVPILQQMSASCFEQHLKVINCAINQKNKYIAKKHIRMMEKKITDCPLDLKHQFFLSISKIKYMSAELESDMYKKMSLYTSSWEHSQKLLHNSDLSVMLNIDVLHHISKLSSHLARLSKESVQFNNLLKQNRMIISNIQAEDNDSNDAQRLLETYAFNNLRKCCDISTIQVEASYLALSKYCYDRVFNSDANLHMYKEFIYSTLKAMSYGSLEAAHYFPCLLKAEYLEQEDAQLIFIRECKIVPTWLFLSSQAQLLSHLGTSLAPLILPIIERLVTSFPNAVIYTFGLTMETNPVLLQDAKIYAIRQLLYNKQDVQYFLTAMHYVVQPELYLQYYLSEFLKTLPQGTITAVNTLFNRVYPLSEDVNVVQQGKIYKVILKYKNKIKNLENKNIIQIKKCISEILKDLQQSLRKRESVTHLKDYSPWLHEFTEGNLEIPGQYTGNKQPLPQYHTKIIKIEPAVKVMPSLRKPIRITLVGNDGKNYNFLVKFGEDLRLDQRLQQIFEIINKTLCTDICCKQRCLSIDTYQVIPLSKSLGLIQWVDNTRSLKELMLFTLTKKEVSQCEAILAEYAVWIRNAAPYKSEAEQYKESALKYSATKVITKMNQLSSKIKWDALRKSFLALSQSFESFVSLRHNFITSYATICVVHWILGIGDRNLENTLMSVGSGRSLGIDFGYAFGASIDLRIPELIPFRLTPQILGLLKPFTENDLFGETMIHALRAIRNSKEPILACLDVFIHEPLNWTEHVNKVLQESESNVNDIKWLPKKKIAVVIEKLEGRKPSVITIEQLKEQHNDKYFERYSIIVSGNDEVKGIRASMKNDQLTPEDQVKCLLDQATDLNILGRTYAGWRPWL